VLLEVTMADHIVVAALAFGAGFLVLTAAISVVVVRRRDPVGKAVAGYANARQALRDTSARATGSPTRGPSPLARAPGEDSHVLSSVSVIAVSDGGAKQ
jgi:hypothetical protein